MYQVLGFEFQVSIRFVRERKEIGKSFNIQVRR